MVLKEDNNNQYSHAERLHKYIDAVLQQANIAASDLSAVAVSKGPGSYTGLRIGVSAAKGLCYALNAPLISVNTLQALALEVEQQEVNSCIVPMLDARRMEVYASVFDANYNEVRATKAEILNENSFLEQLNAGKVYFVGNSNKKAKTLITHPNAVFLAHQLPTAKTMCRLSYDKFKSKNFEDVAYFEPYYLKDFMVMKPKPKV